MRNIFYGAAELSDFLTFNLFHFITFIHGLRSQSRRRARGVQRRINLTSSLGLGSFWIRGKMNTERKLLEPGLVCNHVTKHASTRVRNFKVLVLVPPRVSLHLHLHLLRTLEASWAFRGAKPTNNAIAGS
mmetsp:Transcript_30558/g.64942  ORF Transcript_30558/g.64942 Transcript_30558/m.64942 type:complete len:130 (-) Transcript_30558:32-421(-)